MIGKCRLQVGNRDFYQRMLVGFDVLFGSYRFTICEVFQVLFDRFLVKPAEGIEP